MCSEDMRTVLARRTTITVQWKAWLFKNRRTAFLKAHDKLRTYAVISKSQVHGSYM